MRYSDITLIICILILGPLILWSYKSQLFNKGKSFFDNEYWLNMNPNVIKFIIPWMVLAAIGFLTFTIAYLISPPKKGLLSYPSGSGWATPIIVTIFLAASLGWSFAVKAALTKKSTMTTFTTSITLVIAAIAAICLLAGSMEDGQIALIVGSLFLTIQCALIDGVGWNAKFILKQK